MPSLASLMLLAATVAQQANHPGESNPEVVITGERVPRSVRDTPSSVAVITSRDIDAMAAPDRVEQILEVVPNVQLGPGTEGPSIRGQDTTGAIRDLPAFLGGARPRTTLIVDGRPVGYNEFISGAAPIWDVDRVEVFRSPQMTTQGKNSIAGAIFIFTEDPAMRAEYRARAIVGEAHTRQLSAVVSAPVLADQAAIRISGDYRYSHPSSDMQDRVPGADADHDEFGLLRVKLLATPERLPGARIELTYTHTAAQMPQSENVRGPDFRKREDLSGFAGIARTNVDALIAAVRYDFSPQLTANTAISRGDLDMQRFALVGLGQTEISTKDWFAETIFNWTPDGPLEFVGGVSHLRQFLRQHIHPVVLIGEGTFKDWQDGTGLFGEARINVAPRAILTAGLRYQRDGQKRTGTIKSGSSLLDLDYDRNFDAWLPKVSLAYDFSPTFRAGVLVQRGYNPGGVTLRPDLPGPDTFDAETLWDYELFARASFAGSTVEATANLFYYAMRNAQRIQTYMVQRVGLADLFNVPKARTFGAEAQVDWRASRQLSASLGLGLLGTKIVSTDAAYASFQGNEFQRSPHFSATGSVEWRPIDRLLVSALFRHNSGYWSDEANTESRRISGWTRFDAQVDWQFGSVRLFGYARNIFDKFYMTTLFSPPVLGTAGDPRELGVGIHARF
jgi:outer membrane receptor protein involved in Fe transport